MRKSYYNQIKKEDMKFDCTYAKSEQNKKKDFDEIEKNVIPYYSHSSIAPIKQKFQVKPKLTAKLYIGDQSFSKSLFEDKLIIQRIKRHLDQEYLDKYRNKYIFSPSPPRPEMQDTSQRQQLKMSINLTQPNHKSTKFLKKTSDKYLANKSSTKQNKIIVNTEKEDYQKNITNQEQENKLNCDDDLPIALRRTKRPKTKPLRFWLGEKIVYKIDEETGCYTKALEVKVNQNEDSVKKQEIIVEKNSKKIINSRDRTKMLLIESGQLFIKINNKQFKASAGCKLYLQKGQEITFINQSDDNSIISMI